MEHIPTVGEHSPQRLPYRRGMDTGQKRGTQLVLRATAPENPDGAQNVVHHRLRQRRHGSVMFRIRKMLDIHRHEIHRSGGNQLPEHFGIGTVRIELHTIAQRLHPLQKSGESGVQRRLAARNHHPIEPAAAACEIVEHLALRHIGPLPHQRRHHQRRIVTIAAAEVASLGKDHRRQHAVPIHEALFHQPPDAYALLLHTAHTASDAAGSFQQQEAGCDTPSCSVIIRSKSRRSRNSSRLPSFHWLTGRM